MDTCVFCDIAGKTIPAEIVYEDDTVVAFPDKNPQAPVHLLVIPKQHTASVDEAASNQAELFGKILLAAAAVGKQETNGDFSLQLNAGGHIEVPHLHVHVKGSRKGGDDV
jgi:histidine triad (HIT) family protein